MKFMISSILLACCMSSGEWFMHKGDLQEKAYTSQSRYVIVHNEVIVDKYEPSYTHRSVKVLLDEKAFSPNTLRQLFMLLSNSFPVPDNLTVDVYTNLDQVDTPEERESGKVIFEGPNGNSNPTREELIFRRYPYAILIRQDGNEIFRYSVNLKNSKLRTIVLKGKDPMS